MKGSTLPSISMEVKNGPIVKETIVSDGPILHFQDNGRKSNHFTLVFYCIAEGVLEINN